MSALKSKAILLKRGKYMDFWREGYWEYVKRNNCTGIVIVLAVTTKNELILTEQFRVPVGKKVIEFPAGLANDLDLVKRESLAQAAKRELFEEAGYTARRIVKIFEGPTSGGSSADIITIMRAYDLRKVSAGGGDHTEAIKVYTVPLSKVERWLVQKRQAGSLVDPKIYAGLYFLKKYNR